jgi:DNA-binding Lrp family transcriptional regulator
MIEAYVLIQTDVGTGSKVAKEVLAIPDVLLAHVVTGPYDLVTRLQAEDFNGVNKIVDEIQRVPGVTRTMTCPVIRF